MLIVAMWNYGKQKHFGCKNVHDQSGALAVYIYNKKF